MAIEFNRIITLLRKERGITQKQAAQELGISQAQLSHYEKGIRECGLEFVVQIADYYNVSCDYLLGRSAERSGQTIKVEELPDAGGATSGSIYRGSVLPTMYKKLIENSLDILFDRLDQCKDKRGGYLRQQLSDAGRLPHVPPPVPGCAGQCGQHVPRNARPLGA